MNGNGQPEAFIRNQDLDVICLTEHWMTEQEVEVLEISHSILPEVEL